MAGYISLQNSRDAKYWYGGAVFGGASDYGLSMTNYRGELYGIRTASGSDDKKLFATKYGFGNSWRPYKALDEKYLSQGRTSVTVLDDQFFILRRGTNDAVYLLQTEDFDTYNDIGRIGSKYAETKVAPAIAAYNGLLYMVGVGEDKYIYFTTADKDGKRTQKWKKIDGTGTQSALELVVFRGKLYLFHTGYNNDAIFYQCLEEDDEWSKPKKFSTEITSGVSATSWKYNKVAIAYRGKDNNIKYVFFDGEKFGEQQAIDYIFMKYQLGLATYGGQLWVTYAQGQQGYQSRALIMDEKSGMFTTIEEAEEEWKCKWNQKDEDSSKTWVRKMFCM